MRCDDSATAACGAHAPGAQCQHLTSRHKQGTSPYAPRSENAFGPSPSRPTSCIPIQAMCLQFPDKIIQHDPLHIDGQPLLAFSVLPFLLLVLAACCLLFLAVATMRT